MKHRRGVLPSKPVDAEEGLPRSRALLQALHLLTRDGQLNQDARRKLKQVDHLCQFIAQLLDQSGAWQQARIDVVDHGAGKSYLGFLLMESVLNRHPNAWMHGIERRAELIAGSEQLAQAMGLVRMRFVHGDTAAAAQAANWPETVDLVTALHACDTATDDAIAFALARRARAVALVPCCQAEAARFLRQHKALNPRGRVLAELWRHPLHTREVGAQATNVMRCLYLEAMGYQVTVTELVGWEHSLKNELILARRVGPPRLAAAQRLRDLVAELGLEALLPLRYALLPAAASQLPDTDGPASDPVAT